MYDWLADVRADTSQVVTASRRLARVLAQEFSRHRLALGHRAWKTPTILAYPDWLLRLAETGEAGRRPTFINAQQSRNLWEQVLREEVRDPLVNFAGLTRQAREAWLRLHQWQVPFDEFLSSAGGRDQRIFARAAATYRELLQSANWADDAMLPGIVLEAVRRDELRLPATVFITGFDRTTPRFDSLTGAIRDKGSDVDVVQSETSDEVCCMAFDHSDRELRAAGAWAAGELSSHPGLRIGIVVPDLERGGGRQGRLIREGFVPGWQCGTESHRAAVNVSYGRRLADYPAIGIALSILRWSHRELSGRELSLLLRTPFVGEHAVAGRARLELELRGLPDRRWTPARFGRAFGGGEQAPDALDWLRRIGRLADVAATLPARASPAKWAGWFDTMLETLNWPGAEPLDSADFQLVNRWRDLLGELTRLELVSPVMTLAEAFAEIASMAADTVFQPEAEGAVVQVLGPLEAAGLRFDRLWVTGLTVANWPPASRPMALLSRRLQRQYGMPDADPRDTAEYAGRVLSRLLQSAPVCVCSYAMTEGDAEQSPASMLEGITTAAPAPDPGWQAAALSVRTGAKRVGEDSVPPVQDDEILWGGAAIIQYQVDEPFSAFAYGRLGIERLRRITPGLPPMLRGNLIHAAMFRLYEGRPRQRDISAWQADELGRRIDAASAAAFLRYERSADPLLAELLALEKKRVAVLLRNAVEVDRRRQPFAVVAVEKSVDFEIQAALLRLRIDRIDRYDDGTVAILDYKTGGGKKMLDGEGRPADLQLVVYACALPEPVAALGFFNIDSRNTGISGAGREAGGAADWDEQLGRWAGDVEAAAAGLVHGDIRIDGQRSPREARALGLLSRFGELRRDA